MQLGINTSVRVAYHDCQPRRDYGLAVSSGASAQRLLGVLVTLLSLVLAGGRAAAQGAPPADPAATTETRQLLANLHRLVGLGVLFGHQDDLAYGIDQGKRWKGEANRSDVKSATGAYPAVFGWELGHLELDSTRNLDGVPFGQIKQYIGQVYALGAINTISWHLNNPHNGKTAWDTARTIRYLLPGGPDHAAYVDRLAKVADFLGSLKGAKGEAIPVIFRPFHEHTGNWFWWGEEASTPAEFKALWQFTVNYLRETRKLHNLLIAYSAAEAPTLARYLERYPGDAYVDVVGFDAYHTGDGRGFQQQMTTELPILQTLARTHHKLPALTEFGYENIPNPTWWTSTLLPLLRRYPVSYSLTWRNGDPAHYYTPTAGQPSMADFQDFAQQADVLLANRMRKLHLYTSAVGC